MKWILFVLKRNLSFLYEYEFNVQIKNKEEEHKNDK